MQTKSFQLVRRRSARAAAGVALGLAALNVQAQHGHLNAGATGVNPGDSLYFANGDIFSSASGYVKELPLASSGTYVGYYEGNITFTALPTTVDNGGPVANAPAPGSFIMTGIRSVQGPSGGAFGFWEEGATEPSLSYSVGYDSPVPTGLWALSDASSGAGQPGGDPFGHLHGRRFTASLPGEYTVGFQLFDVSANGVGGGPIHTPSPTLFITFSAVPEPSAVVLGLVGAAGIIAVARQAKGRRTAGTTRDASGAVGR